MKCQIRWIDLPSGEPTPDDNDAVQIAHIHRVRCSASGGVTYAYSIENSFPICAEHLKMVKPSWKYGAGGGWSFEPLAKESQ